MGRQKKNERSKIPNLGDNGRFTFLPFSLAPAFLERLDCIATAIATSRTETDDARRKWNERLVADAHPELRPLAEQKWPEAANTAA